MNANYKRSPKFIFLEVKGIGKPNISWFRQQYRGKLKRPWQKELRTAVVSGPLFVAKQIAAHAKEEGYDMIFLGKETIDYNGSEVGGMVAELLDMPYVSFATGMEVNENVATITREIEGGVEVSEIATPIVISASKGLAEQRIPNMRGIMMAKRKPLKVVQAIEAEDLAVTVSYELPPEKSEVKLVDAEDMNELVRLLHEEAKVI